MWQLGRRPDPHRRATVSAEEELTCARHRSLSARTGPSPLELATLASAGGAYTPRKPHSNFWAAPPKQRGGAHPPVPLASSIHRGCSSRAPTAADPSSHPYQWTPFHIHHNHPSVCTVATAALGMWGKGVYVNTLTMDLRKETFEGAVPHVMRLDSERFVPKRQKPWCYMLRGSIPCVVVKGIIVCTAPSSAEGRQGPLVVGELPEDMRPARMLRFAAAVRRCSEAGSTATQLVTLQVHPSGLVVAEDGKSGQDDIVRGSEIDLSAIRFCMGNGMSLIDEVNMYLCDVNGTRVVCLQGELHERFFNSAGRKALALLPASCRPPEDIFFISPGTRGGYHLLLARPKGDTRSVDTGDLIWRDSKWHRDTICVNGLMWEVPPEALSFDNPMTAVTATESQVIAIMDFQRYLCRRFGSVQMAWHEAFDTDGSGSVNFTEFGLGCKAAGYVGNASKLWAALDIDRSGEISLQELDADSEAVLHELFNGKLKQIADLDAEAMGYQAKRELAGSSRSTAVPSPFARISLAPSPCSTASNRWNSRPSSKCGTVLDVLEKSIVRRQSLLASPDLPRLPDRPRTAM